MGCAPHLLMLLPCTTARGPPINARLRYVHIYVFICLSRYLVSECTVGVQRPVVVGSTLTQLFALQTAQAIKTQKTCVGNGTSLICCRWPRWPVTLVGPSADSCVVLLDGFSLESPGDKGQCRPSLNSLLSAVTGFGSGTIPRRAAVT
jgi:hypothetical protein